MVLEKNPGYRDFKIPVLEKNSGYQDFKIMVLEKNPGYRDFKSTTENRVESLCNRENIPGASRPSKPLPVSYETLKTGCPWGGEFAVGQTFKNMSISPFLLTLWTNLPKTTFLPYDEHS